MICPHCHEEIPDNIVARHFASRGGKKSRRKLSPEQARKMAEARWSKRDE